MLNRRRVLTLLAAASVAPALAEARTTWQGIALGAEVRITLLGAREAAESALQAARNEIHRMEALFSLYRADSMLSRLNAAGRLETVEPDFAALLTLADEAYRITNGRFDPTVQPLWAALASGLSVAEARAQTQPLMGWEKVRRDAGVTLKPGMALTFNGIAQGFVTDAVADLLTARGFPRQLVDIGEIRAGEGDWRVGLSDPELGHFSTLPLSRMAVATSSPRALVFKDGQGHILGPKGEVVHWSTVSIEAHRAGLADALSTAFCLTPRRDIAAVLAATPAIKTITLVDARGEVSTL